LIVVSCRGIVVMVLLLLSYCHGLVIIAIVIVTIVSIVVNIAFVVAVVIDHCCPCCLHCRHFLCLSWWRSNGGAAMGAAMAEKVVAQQWRWRRSNGNGGAATAWAVQRWQWRCSNSLGGAATAFLMAAQQWGWQWWWRRSNGGAAMVEAAQQWWWTEAIIEYHRIESYSVFVKQIDILCSFLWWPHTDRFPDEVPKKLQRDRNYDSCKKKRHRSGKNRNPEDSCRIRQPSFLTTIESDYNIIF
jgi:hypothetical protein